MDIYADNILDHYRHPRNTGHLPSPALTRDEINAACGDHLTLDMQITDDRIVAVRWTGQGCAISQAAMSILSEELPGMSVTDALAMTPRHVRDLLGVPVSTRRIKCALLCLHTLKNAILPAPQGWEETLREDV